LVVLGFRGYSSLRRVVVGIDYIAIGMLLFSMAVLISMAMGGVLPWQPAGRKRKGPHVPE
jgi:hypothetical protein